MTILGYIVVEQLADGTYDLPGDLPLFELDDRESAQAIAAKYSALSVAEVHLSRLTPSEPG